MKIITIIAFVILSSALPVSHAAVIKLHVDNGILMGADNVLVNGSLYNVKFQDGTCIELFDGCDQQSDFVFQTFDEGRAASSALATQVFIDGPEGDFDTKPWLTNGCSRIDVCEPLTLFDLAENGSVFKFAYLDNYRFSFSPSIVIDEEASMSISLDHHAFAVSTFAVWSKTFDVMAPTGAMLTLFGAIGLIVTRRRVKS